METPRAVSSGSDEDFHSINGDGRSLELQQSGGAQDHVLVPPEHPLKSMQGPFEESIVESTLEATRPNSRPNAELRRQRLLDAARFDDAWTSRWKQRQDAKFHPLLKLMAQITFGMHLLQQNQAKNDSEVVKILQDHVDEVDNFLEQTAEDFDLAARDIDERIRFLQLPMQHIKVFNIMLDDKHFRTQLLDGNDKIERIIDRTARAMNAALLDVQKGRQATRELSKYLNSVQYTWPVDKPDLDAIYNAMRGNEEGWKKCYKDLQARGNHLGNKLIELGTIIGEMSKMAGAASRRVGPAARPTSSGTSSIRSSTMLRSRFSPDARSGLASPTDKPLPRAPNAIAEHERTQSLKARPISFHQRFEYPREVPVPSRVTTDGRPKTSSGVRGEAGQPSSLSSRRASGPLSSHPPETIRPKSAGTDRANGSAKHKAAASMTAPITTTDSKSHARAGSSATARNRNSFIGDNVLPGSSFARRWSIRKKHPGPTPDDYMPSPALKKRDSVNLPAPILKSPSQQRLATVSEGAVRARQANPIPRVDGSARQNMPKISAPVPIPPDPSSTNNDILLGKSRSRQSIMSSTAESKRGAPSFTSSLKRRSISLRAMFGRSSRKE